MSGSTTAGAHVEIDRRNQLHRFLGSGFAVKPTICVRTDLEY